MIPAAMHMTPSPKVMPVPMVESTKKDFRQKKNSHGLPE
jgi:hypothetical protein